MWCENVFLFYIYELHEIIIIANSPDGSATDGDDIHLHKMHDIGLGK